MSSTKRRGAQSPPPVEKPARVTHFRLAGSELAVISFSAETIPMAELTEAERQVLDGVLRGWSDREIAHARGTSPRTVANQLRSLTRKLGVTSRSELVAAVSRPTN